jgi:hypothetical protein
MGQLIVYACRLSSENRRDKERKRLHVVDGDKARYEAILNRSAVNIQTRGEAFRSSGWSGYDPKAPQFTAEQVRAERERYRAR